MATRASGTHKDEIRLEGAMDAVAVADWRPLEGLVSERLMPQFRWAGAVMLVDGTLLQGYEHRFTSRTIYLSEAGRGFWFDWESVRRRSRPKPEYVQAERFALLVSVFDWGAGNGRRPWSGAATDSQIQLALRASMFGLAFLTDPHPLDASCWNPEEDGAVPW